jgi:thiamine pyrophosphate-dependent acetolactate synthase large subunit-like protein
MRRQMVTALCSAAMGMAAALTLAIHQQAANAASSRPVYYSSIKELMDSIIDPSADVIWGAAGTIIDKDEGVRELTPRTDEGWRDVRRAAVRIIEGGNLLMMPGRDAAPAGTKSETPGVELEPTEITALLKKNRKSFDDFARALQALGLEASRASDTKNADLLMDVGARMDAVCESCHQTFWYPYVSRPQSGRQ